MAFIKLLLNGDDANMYKLKVLDKYYNLSYKDLRRRPLYNYYAIAITLAVIAVYIRCIYRVVELAQGFSGYLITHEVYIMTLDAAMIGICCIIFILFHPQVVMGSSNVVGLRSIAKNKDQETGDKSYEEKLIMILLVTMKNRRCKVKILLGVILFKRIRNEFEC